MKRLVSIAVLAMTLACSIVKAGNPETKPRDSLEKIGTYCSAISYPWDSAGAVEEKLPWFEAQYYGFSLVVCGYCYHKNAATDAVRKCVADYHGRLPDELAIVAEAYSRFSNGKENIGTLTDISWKWLTRKLLSAIPDPWSATKPPSQTIPEPLPSMDIPVALQARANCGIDEKDWQRWNDDQRIAALGNCNKR
jgi:hypothetical protein